MNNFSGNCRSSLGFQPRISAGRGTTPEVIGVRASDPTKAHDLANVNQRPIGSNPPLLFQFGQIGMRRGFYGQRSLL